MKITKNQLNTILKNTSNLNIAIPSIPTTDNTLVKIIITGVYNTPQVKNPSGVGVDKVLQAIQQVNDRITAMDDKFTKAISDLDTKFTNAIKQVNDRITAMDTKFTQRFDRLEDKVDKILTLPTVKREMQQMYPAQPETT